MKTVFLDRDGVINKKAAAGCYITSWQQFEFLPGAIQAVRLLNDAGYLVMVVTNQRGVSLGLMTEQQVNEIHTRMREELGANGARVDAVYYCPHAEGSCDCRKPDIGLFELARSDFPDIKFDEALVIGDSDRDLDAGRRLGARLIRIGGSPAPDELRADSLLDAVQRHVINTR